MAMFNNINLLDKIKSNYIIKHIMDYLLQNKMLKFIKYNKGIQKRLNMNITDYKDYSNIEIEIIPKEYLYGVFIENIKKDEEPYYHIYFNNNKKEIKTNSFNKFDKVTKIKVIIYGVKSLKELFSDCKCIQKIKFKKFTNKNITDMSYMFYGCTNLEKLNLTNFITDKVTDMSRMFGKCSSLKKLNLLHFNTNNVIDISGMFYNCSSLKELNLPYYNIKKIKNINDIFYGCSDKFLDKIRKQIELKDEEINSETMRNNS